jgi:glycosidase
MRFWLKRGVSGFRMDSINFISKVSSLPDAEIEVPGARYQPGHKHYINGPRLDEYLREMRSQALNKYDTITVGETPYIDDPEEILKLIDPKTGYLNMIFIFDMVDIDKLQEGRWGGLRKWDLRELKSLVNKWQRIMIEHDGWNSIFLENHDTPRSVSRFVDDRDEFREQGAKLLAMLQCTLSGTLYIYQGQELGMRNVPESWAPEEYKDVESTSYWSLYALSHSPS